jgi:nitrogen-specific signal transduction histidine kinase
MAWVSLEALRLDRAQTEARHQAALEENVRLALWRMDSALAPIVAEESAWPHDVYDAFIPPRVMSYNSVQPVLPENYRPSPLLLNGSPWVRLYFRVAPDGAVTSPQVPVGEQRKWAVASFLNAGRLKESAAMLEKLKPLLDRDVLLARLPAEEPRPTEVARGPENLVTANKLTQQAIGNQASRNAAEWQQRAQNTLSFSQIFNLSNAAASGATPGLMKPVWLGENLLLARRVSTGRGGDIQGCWLDWPKLSASLLERVTDLLPDAKVQPAPADSAGKESRLLTALPVLLVPGKPGLVADDFVSVLPMSLGVAWGCVLLAIAAVAALLWGTVSLSERRASFVSAVTHELRTPLTTLRLYSEMLAEGKVRPEDREQYLSTMRAEADRLGHLVENVLGYARLERGRAARALEAVTIGSLVERAKQRLCERATQAGMTLAVEISDADAATSVRADASAVEQILFNLVDNACKYAAGAGDKRIHLRTGSAEVGARICVCDHGPGISRRDVRALFRPFRKSAKDAAASAPGVGLGLAFSRRLARAMGGELDLDRGENDGACFVLKLAQARPPQM